MRFHVVGLPHTQTVKSQSSCAYTNKVRRFCNMMMVLGHEVYLYASEDNDADCTEFVTIITKEKQREFWEIPEEGYAQITWNPNDVHWVYRNQQAIEAIKPRLKPKDFIIVFDGAARLIAEELNTNMTVEAGIGYSGTFSEYLVFESYGWMHAVLGQQAAQNGEDVMNVYGKNFHTVIPNSYDLEEFPFQQNKEDYYLYIGRLTDSKGWMIAQQVCEKLGKRLIVAGSGKFSGYGEYVGLVGPEKRAELMGKATAVFVPSLYLEPFGGVAAEAMLCGTPVITSDWGAFPENNIQGLTGYRCRMLQEFCQAAEKVKYLNFDKIREHAVKNFSTGVVSRRYEYYFKRLRTLWAGGWPDQY